MATSSFGAHALGRRLALANTAAFVAAGGVGWLIAQILPDRSWECPVALLVGFVLSWVASRRLVRRHELALVHLGELMEEVHSGTFLPTDPDGAGGGVERALRRMLARLEQESSALSGKLIAVLEAERRRIGRELHDETSQTLALVLLHIDEAARADAEDEVRQHLDAARDLIDNALDELKNIVYGLMPVLLENLGLEAAVRWYVSTTTRDSGVTAVLDFDTPVPPPDEVRTALFRIVQEAVSNVVRHADAARLTVQVETRPGYAAVAVIDDGNGFDVAEKLVPRPTSGLGLLSIRERAKLLGGTLNVTSQTERGTALHVVIPLPEDPP